VLRNAKLLRQVLSCLGSRQRIALSYDPARQSITAIKPPLPHAAGWQESSFIRAYKPVPRLILCGRGIELDATTNLCRALEFEALSFDGRSTTKFNENDIDQDTAVALLFHDLDQELPVLKAALKKPRFTSGRLAAKEPMDGAARHCGRWDIPRHKPIASRHRSAYLDRLAMHTRWHYRYWLMSPVCVKARQPQTIGNPLHKSDRRLS
jgi:hypothetical protein